MKQRGAFIVWLALAVWPAQAQSPTTVIGAGALPAFYNPTYYTNPGTGVVDRFNRVFIGAATQVSSDVVAGNFPSTPGWVDTLLSGAIVAASSLAAGSPFGANGIVGYSRTSDYTAAFGGGNAGGADGVSGIAYNDETVGQSIGVGILGVGIQAASITGITAASQFDVDSTTTPVADVNSINGVVAGSTIAAIITPGAYPTVGTQNISAGIIIGPGWNGAATPQFRKGVVCINGSLIGSVGASGAGTCLEMAQDMGIRWLDGATTSVGEITADGTGVNFPVDQPWQTFAPAPSCGTATFTINSAHKKTLGKATFIGIDISVASLGTCASILLITLPNFTNSGSAITGVEAGATGKTFTCSAGSGAGVMSCRLADVSNFSSVARIVGSGVYENQ
jgi:hypothetical protein